MNSFKFVKLKPVDGVLLSLVIILVSGGFFIFLSAALGLLASGQVPFSSIVFNQLFLGIVLGITLMTAISRVHYKKLRKYTPLIFGFSLFVTFLVFIPGIGMSWGGASRWIQIGPLTFQPVELLKLGSIVFFAHFLALNARKVRSVKFFGIVSLGAGLGIISVPLLLQPDTGSLIVIFLAVSSMFFVAGLKWKDLGILLIFSCIALIVLIMSRPYILDRIKTFLDPGADTQGAGYQINQSLIAVGSGGITGRGFGQSVQKFNYLPEPISDSIFAVYAEEFGFVGAILLLGMFIALSMRMYGIAIRAPDMFGALLVVGLSSLIIAQSLFNMSAMLGVVPLSGLPLIFVSHGGTALAMALLGMGIALNVSRYAK